MASKEATTKGVKRHALVIPGTSLPGSAVCEVLIERGFLVFGASLNIHCPALVEKSVIPIEFAYGDVSSIETAIKLSRANAVVFATDFYGAAGRNQFIEIEHGKIIIDACKKLNVGYVVYLSIADADKDVKIDQFASKNSVECYLKETLTTSHVS